MDAWDEFCLQTRLASVHLACLSSITLVISKSRYLNDQLNLLEDHCLSMNVITCFLYVLGKE
jgi:hypothetical protein